MTAELPAAEKVGVEEGYDAKWLAGFFAELGKRLNCEVKAHPVLKLPSLEVVRRIMLGNSESAKRGLLEALQKRARAIDLMTRDPLRYGWEPFMWEEARRWLAETGEVLLLGGNRSTKSEFGGKEVCRDLVGKPGRIWACFQSSEQASIALQHPRIYKYLPPEWRDLGKSGKRTFVCYTEKGGFSDGIFILPNGSKCHFFNYKQDVKVFEGYEFDGVWFDELVPIEFLETMRFRLVTRAGKMLTTFTPKEGYTPVVGEYLAGARLEKSLKSGLLPGENVKGCPAGEMPYVMRHATRQAGIIFFHSEHNAFSPFGELEKMLEGAPTPRVKMRAYGWVDRAVGIMFPKFGAHNIIGPEKVPKEGTNYHLVDFAWARKWAQVWLRVTEYKGKKRIYAYRDWPDFGTHGEWVLPTRTEGNGKQLWDGYKGPAQTVAGFGIKDYKRMILAAENGERIFRRIGDKRSGNAEAVADEGGTTLISRMAEEQEDEGGKMLPSMFVEPSVGDSIQEGVNLINEWLEFDDGRPITVENEPMFYVSTECRQVIDCLRNWTGQDGLKGASKDFIDLLRYAAQAGLEHVEEGTLGSAGGGGY